MSKTLTALVASVALLGATATQAATAVYKIKNIDAASHTVTLGNDQAYVVDSSVKLDDFKVGDQVRITFTSENGKNTASALVKL
jgi:Cu/Ag efflux protein CusF